MNINGIQSVHGAHSLSGPHLSQRAAGNATARPTTTDQLEISLSAQSALSETDIRSDRVAQIKQQIAEGSYETADKLDAALERLIDQLG